MVRSVAVREDQDQVVFFSPGEVAFLDHGLTAFETVLTQVYYSNYEMIVVNRR